MDGRVRSLLGGSVSNEKLGSIGSSFSNPLVSNVPALCQMLADSQNIPWPLISF